RRARARLARARARGRPLLRARLGRGSRRGRARCRARRRARRVRGNRPRAEGSRRTGEARRMTIHVRAPATSANLGPGFDVAAVAFDLWNEVEVGDENGALDETHLGVRAFAKFASPRGRSFRFTDRIPRERGLGSSAAVVALGLVAGALASGKEPSADELLHAGLELEGHADNLAAALVGGVCLTWDGRIARIADDTPAAAVAVVPSEH